MKLDRNINPGGRGKYALVLLREVQNLSEADRTSVENAIDVLNHAGCLDFGEARDNEFFVIRIKDQCAEASLLAYYHEAVKFDPEYAAEIRELADKAATHPRKKQPD